MCTVEKASLDKSCDYVTCFVVDLTISYVYIAFSIEFVCFFAVS